MKLTRTQWMLVAIGVAIAIWYFFLRNKKGEESGMIRLESTTVTPKKSSSLYNKGQICRKDNQCGGTLKCINGKCDEPISNIPRPISPTTTTTPTVTPKTFTTTLATGNIGSVIEDASPKGTTVTGTGVVSPKGNATNLSNATGIAVELGYV